MCQPFTNESRLLKVVAQNEGIEVTWTYDDVYNRFSLSTEEKVFDASNLADWLQARRDRGLPASIYINAMGQLERVFFVVEGSREFWAKSPMDNVLLYDTTFSTNRAGMKLGCGTGVNDEGQSNLLFISLVCFQDAESFEWVFMEFMLAYKRGPVVIFTDSDLAMKNAIEKRLTPNGTKHMLCTWHLSKNLATNMKSTAGTQWYLFEKKWWMICKETDLLSRSMFDKEWAELLAILPPSNSEGRAKALVWLEGLKDRKEQWAARWTWEHFTAGVHSTQRAE